ncbi:hypothetical protein DY703_05110 [Salmonella enterica]|nr:hypothetical protein [Salmonella enterica]EBQ9478325.1 hypothetical protein [Salmonella enterica subsp. enterica serovar Kokomlemle]ECX4751461.1 hypothetical protein [Salmonella enterica]EGJ5835236.1 hypothetical protein [Salmonella enterica]EHQ5241556.1 hypothetical protein [Salmonella enterica]
MPLPNAFIGISGNSPYLSENDIPKPQPVPQPVQVVQPVPQYYAMQTYAATPQPPQQKDYVILPLKYDPKKADSEPLKIIFVSRNDLIDVFSKRLNDAGVVWVDSNTGKDNNGVQVRQPVNISDEDYKELNKLSPDE